VNFVEWLEEEAKRLNDTANKFEAGTVWVGDTLTPSQTERNEAAIAMRDSAIKLQEIAKRMRSR
jgi:hypothetical protein